MFGFQTSTSKRLLDTLMQLFDKITVVKPITSRPASAERYVVFQGYKGTPHDYDGPQWQRNLLNTTTTENHDLQYCLDECDYDILQLNQMACFEILSYMERKAMGISFTGKPRAAPIHIQAFKHEWRL
jgi:hypothetical protein